MTENPPVYNVLFNMNELFLEVFISPNVKRLSESTRILIFRTLSSIFTIEDFLQGDSFFTHFQSSENILYHLQTCLFNLYACIIFWYVCIIFSSSFTQNFTCRYTRNYYKNCKSIVSKV